MASSSSLLEQIKGYVCTHFELGEDAVDTMLPVFFSTLQNHMKALENAIAGDDLTVTSKAGHTLKGALLNLGLDETAAVAKTIEDEGRAGNCDAEYLKMLEQLREKLAEIL
jgi:HPt (histidine-containing phosphotransfer) domain-containing protein